MGGITGLLWMFGLPSLAAIDGCEAHNDWPGVVDTKANLNSLGMKSLGCKAKPPCLWDFL